MPEDYLLFLPARIKKMALTEWKRQRREIFCAVFHVFNGLSLKAGVATFFDPLAEFATAW